MAHLLHMKLIEVVNLLKFQWRN